MSTSDAFSGPGAEGLNRKATFERYAQYFASSDKPLEAKLSDFPKYIPREALSRFLVKYEIFKHILHVQGSIVECGVFGGAGLMTFAQLSEMLEPTNHQRKIIGFDTFEGFPDLSNKDLSTEITDQHTVGGIADTGYDELVGSVELFNSTRYLHHTDKVSLVKGNIVQSIPNFVLLNPHLVVSLLYLDSDLYEPTKAAIENILPRMPKGAVIAFDELNDKYWPGETVAVIETLGLRNLKIQRSFATSISYVVLE